MSKQLCLVYKHFSLFQKQLLLLKSSSISSQTSVFANTKIEFKGNNFSFFILELHVSLLTSRCFSIIFVLIQCRVFLIGLPLNHSIC